MSKYRSIVALAMAFVMTLFIAFASPAEAKTKKASKAAAYTYSAEQIETIQNYAADIDMMRGRLTELGELIDNEDWIFTRNFIHGPLGELRFKMMGIARELTPDAAKNARALTRDVFAQLSNIDRAAEDKDFRAAQKAFNEMNAGIDEFLSLLPQ